MMTNNTIATGEAPEDRCLRLCDLFNESLESDQPLNIEDILESVDESEWPTLLTPLIRIEHEYLWSKGKLPTWSDYEKRFGQYNHIAKEAFVSPPTGASNRYILIEPIGEGGAGQVFRAMDPRLDREVAIKVLKAKHESDENLEVRDACRNRLIQEMRTTASIAHPGIITVFDADIFEKSKSPFIVMEYCAGGSLGRKLRAASQAFDPKEAALLMINIAGAVHHIHEFGAAKQLTARIHCDLKPENILFDDHGNPRVADFGCSMTALSIYISGTFVGATREYASPEQVRVLMAGASESKREPAIDRRTDVWSLGVILYQMVTQQLPFKGRTHDSLYQSILHDDVKPRDLNLSLPEALDAIVRRCLAKNPNDRFQSAKELQYALQNWIDDPHGGVEILLRRNVLHDSPYERRHLIQLRRISWLSGIVAVAGLLFVLGILIVITRSGDQTARLTQIELLLRERMQPQISTNGAVLETLSPELLEKAQVLLMRGTREQRAIAQIALQNFAEADRIIQALKRDPLTEAFDILSLEGDNWYQAGQFDRAVGPLEQALALYPDRIPTRHKTAFAHLKSTEGDRISHRSRAVDICKDTVDRVAKGSVEWAASQLILGIAYEYLALNSDEGVNLAKAFAAYEAARTVFTRDSHPIMWATTLVYLGGVYPHIPSGTLEDNVNTAIAVLKDAEVVFAKSSHPEEWAYLRRQLGRAYAKMLSEDIDKRSARAVDEYNAALTIYTKTSHPHEWALTMTALADAYMSMEDGEWESQASKAVGAYEAALTIHTINKYPTEWTELQLKIGVAYMVLSDDEDEKDNIERAIAAYEGALTMRTKVGNRVDWAVVHRNLGNAYLHRIANNRRENLGKALAAYETSLTFLTKELNPHGWADTIESVGNVYLQLRNNDSDKDLARGVAAYEDALTVYTKDTDPIRWAIIQNNLGRLHNAILVGDRTQNTRNAIAAHQAAMEIFTKLAHPIEWAMTQQDLGKAYLRLPGDGASVTKGIEAFEGALTVFTKSAYPYDWATTQFELGSALLAREVGDQSETTVRAIRAIEDALTVHTKDTYPSEWAATQRLLGDAYRYRQDGAPQQNIEKAIACYEAALTVYTKVGYPQQWALTQVAIGATYRNAPLDKDGSNIAKAIAASEAAITVWERTDKRAWAYEQWSLGVLYGRLLAGDRKANRLKAVAAFEAALTIHTKQIFPLDWAYTHGDMAKELVALAMELPQQKVALYRRAIASLKGALSVYTVTGYPEEHAMLTDYINSLYQEYDLAGGEGFDAILPAD